MNYREFGRDKIKISEVGLGCWQIGGNWGEVRNSTANAILQQSIDSGITFFDTADVYGEGRSETLIGEFLKISDQKDVFVATKVGRLGLYPNGYTRDSVRACVEDSLKRLQMKSLDLVQLHCIPHEVMKKGKVFSWLDELMDEGLIQRYGASVESMEEAHTCISVAPQLYSFQIIFNIFRQKPIHSLFDLAAEKEIGIIARVPLASGLLTGKLTANQQFDESDHRNFNCDGQYFNVGETFAGLPYNKGVALAEKVKQILPGRGTMAQQSLRWILDHPAVSVVIPGASRPEQAKANAEASVLSPISAEKYDALKSLYREEVEAHIRGPY